MFLLCISKEQITVENRSETQLACAGSCSFQPRCACMCACVYVCVCVCVCYLKHTVAQHEILSVPEVRLFDIY